MFILKEMFFTEKSTLVDYSARFWLRETAISLAANGSEIKDSAYFCYCANVLRFSRYSGFL